MSWEKKWGQENKTAVVVEKGRKGHDGWDNENYGEKTEFQCEPVGSKPCVRYESYVGCSRLRLKIKKKGPENTQKKELRPAGYGKRKGKGAVSKGKKPLGTPPKTQVRGTLGLKKNWCFQFPGGGHSG